MARRITVLGTWLIAIPIYAIFPVAPPRLAGAGIVDAVSEQAGFALTGHSTSFYNPLAAVPSLHAGFAFAIGIAAAAALRAPAAKALALLWGPLVSLAVVVTGDQQPGAGVSGKTCGCDVHEDRSSSRCTHAPERAIA